MGEEDITGEVHEKDVDRAQAERLEPQVTRKKEVSLLKGCRCQDCLMLVWGRCKVENQIPHPLKALPLHH